MSGILKNKWVFALWFACALVVVPSAQAAGKKTNSDEGVQPFGLLLGKSTEDQVIEKALELKGEPAGVYNMYANQTYIDNDPNGVVNPHVVIRKFNGLPVDGIKTTGFRFLDGVLYGVVYEVDEHAESEHLLNALRAKYGPARSNWSDDEFTWSIGPTQVYFKKGMMETHKIFIYNVNWTAKVEASNKQVYSEFIREKAQKQQGF